MKQKNEIKRILYTAIGDTDPVRNDRDGAMLHIVRHYKPDLVVMFMSKEMLRREKQNSRYTGVLRLTAPDCEYRIVGKEHEIDEAHKIDRLVPLQDEFIKLKEEFKDAEFLVNLTSGTPQMGTVMALLATDFDITAIQVDTPKRGSNFDSSHANLDKTPLELHKANLDNEENSENRCREPKLKTLKRYVYRNQILSLIEKYEYRGALDIYKQGKKMFDEYVGRLLQHAIYREELLYHKAIGEVASYKGNRLTVQSQGTIKLKLHEYLMLIQLRQERGELAEAIVKLTPFLYELTLYHLEENRAFKLNECCKIDGHKKLLKRSALNRIYPKIAPFLDRKFRTVKEEVELSFANCLAILEGLNEEEDKELLAILNKLNKVVKKLRNDIAHLIIGVDEKRVYDKTGLSSQEIVHNLRKAFQIVAKNKGVTEGFSFRTINSCIKECLEVLPQNMEEE